ncbi:MAG: hypothetical protein ACRDZO_27020, partial [Egibacteraceae bacterium]
VQGMQVTSAVASVVALGLAALAVALLRDRPAAPFDDPASTALDTASPADGEQREPAVLSPNCG